MPNFKEFIKGFEEKPEQPKPQEMPKVEQPKPKEHEITEAKLPESRFLKDDPYYKLVEEKKPKAYREHLFYPEGNKIALHGTSGERLGEFASEDEIKKFVDKKYEKPQPKEEPKAEEPKEDIYTINPQWANVEYDEDYERSYGEGANADDIEFEMSENPKIYEGKTRHQIVAALSNRLNTHPDKIRELLGKPKQEAKPREGSFQQAFGGEQEEQEQNERAELFQKFLDMGYDKGDAQFKVQEVLNRRENAKKEEEFEKLASVGTAFADNGEITINTPWSRNWRNNHKNYLELRSYLDETYGQGNYAIDYLQDETRDNGRETSAKLKVRLY